MPQSVRKVIRCAIYTRKSTSHGLEEDVNSLQVQREVCQAYIRCQEHRDWVEVPTRYDDGGQSGANLERPALHELLHDIERGKVDVVVLYKIDRLTRSLTDFVRLLDVFKSHGVSFVSVTQTFDTSDSMGRLVLNILLTFAQFERELMGERVRDRKAAMLKEGRYAGGLPPFGYLLRAGRLRIDKERADLVREIFERYLTEMPLDIGRDLNGRGVRTRRWTSARGRTCGGDLIRSSFITALISKPIYAGWISLRGEKIRAKIEPLVSDDLWHRANEVRLSRIMPTRDPARYLLLNILYDASGRKMKGKAYGLGHATGSRYYRSEMSTWARGAKGPQRLMVEADKVEDQVVSALVALLSDRARLKDAVMKSGRYSQQTVKALRRGSIAVSRLRRMERPNLRDLMTAIVQRVDVCENGLALHLSCTGLERLLLWDGEGSFRPLPDREMTATDERISTVQIDVHLLCGRRSFSMGLKPCENHDAIPNPWLVTLLEEAAEAHRLVMMNRAASVEYLARQKGMGASYFNRLLRLNYLAPDIQASIFDGTQPDLVTRGRLLNSQIPMDWSQQRAMFGFI